MQDRDSKTDAFKGLTQKLFGKLAEHLDLPTDSDAQQKPPPVSSSHLPPPLPPKSGSLQPQYNPNGYHSSGNLMQSFDALSLSGKPPLPPTPPHSYSDPGATFVGGFYAPPPPLPPSNTSTNNGFAPGPLPRPPAMPMPFAQQPPPYAHAQPQTSLTMQYALQQHHSRNPSTPPSRPASTSVLPSPIQDLNLYAAPVETPTKTKPHAPAINTASSSSSTTTTATSASKPKPNKKPPRRRASSDSYLPTPSSPTPAASSSSKDVSSSGVVQCHGVTKSGKRCTRQVKSNLASGFDASEEVFCHQHSKEVMGPTGFYARKNGDWVTFEDWIPAYLQPDTQVMLRSEMEKSKSLSDVDGYIYTFEILDHSSPSIKLKVGRAVNLVKRIDEWSKQCSSKEQVLRGWYPGVVNPEDDDNSNSDGSTINFGGESGVSLLRGKVRAGPKGPLCHRLERLVHLELADLAFAQPYLDLLWPNLDQPPVVSNTSNGGSGNSTPKKGAKGRGYIKPCPDCGQLHQEIFEFTRVKKGRYKNREWELIVKPIIEKWGAFVESYV